jgi:hypothetical protein
MSDLTSQTQPLKNHTRLQEMAARGVRYSYRSGRVVLPPSMFKGENKQCQSRMLSLEGDMEVRRWGDEERFEAAVHTEEGPKNLKGTVVSPYSSIDIQSGAISRWQITFREADQAIRNAYDTLIPREAIRLISTIWEQLDRTSELAAARSRLLIGKLGKPQLAPLPDWFENQRGKLSVAGEGEAIANPCAVAIAELLVRAALAAAPGDAALTAELETGPMGRVIVDWCVPKGRLQWMVEAIDIPWPSVKVYQVLHRSEHGLPKSLEPHIFYNAFDAIDSFIRFVGNI